MKKKEIFAFLVKLRDSGKINMMLAPPEIVKHFGVTKQEAFNVFEEWAKSLNG